MQAKYIISLRFILVNIQIIPKLYFPSESVGHYKLNKNGKYEFSKLTYLFHLTSIPLSKLYAGKVYHFTKIYASQCQNN